MPSLPILFDRTLVRRHLTRASERFARHRVLFDESCDALLERVRDVKRTFTHALELGARPQGMAARLGLPCMTAGALGADVIADEELLPFAPQSFDLITSSLALHWVNDLPGALAQLQAMLKPEGLFLASLLGGDTLHELRACLMEAEVAVTDGVSPRLAPTLDLATASALLQRAGFHLPVADQESLTLIYPDMFALMRELRGMGETNAHVERLKHPTRRAVFFEAAKLYQERYAVKGGIKATFTLIFLHGWKA